MSDRSPIEWTQATWNPTTGCDRVSPGCDHCYALSLAARLKSMGSTSMMATHAPPDQGSDSRCTRTPWTFPAAGAFPE